MCGRTRKWPEWRPSGQEGTTSTRSSIFTQSRVLRFLLLARSRSSWAHLYIGRDTCNAVALHIPGQTRACLSLTLAISRVAVLKSCREEVQCHNWVVMGTGEQQGCYPRRQPSSSAGSSPDPGRLPVCTSIRASSRGGGSRLKRGTRSNGLELLAYMKTVA